ncbi:MAG: hypothetical protein A2Y17_01825 [Clostridiales bacterium GWF2_38_85]|nr:MAG: hypothetical protein A2Y17_01825 [Clostridiales bacterium GWF2_38_85]HBL84751.1 amidohydrolase [Clostridiales bacterium]
MSRKIIDTHVHVFPDKVAQRATDTVGNYYGINMECNGTVNMLLEKAKIIDVKYFIISSAALKPENVASGNNRILEEAKLNPKFIPLCSIHPLGENMEAELVRIKAEGAKGLKLHPDFQHFNIDMPEMLPLYKIAAELGLPILFHVGDENTDASSPTRLYNVINKVPELTVIAAHMGGYRAWGEAEKVLYGTNVYMDTSDALPLLSEEHVLNQIRCHGVDRIMFGSDYPLRSTYEAFILFDRLALNEEEKNKIYYANAKHLFNLE